jgi:hypothetical protein
MTINLANNNPRIAYSLAQAATQQTFAIPFEFFNNSDVTVYIDGVLKSEGTHYSLTGGDGSTGNVVFNTTVTGATGGSTIVIFRLSDIERTSDFSAGADINRAALNEQLDILTAMIADQDDRIDRTIQVNDYEVAPSLILPTIANRKGKVLAFNATTGAVEAGPTISAVDTVANTAADIQTVADNIAVIQASPTNATNAAASASAASSSASAASSSASSASSSAASAASSFDSFDDRYLGAKTSDPTLDNDGNALLTGALYFDSVGAAMKVYTGSAWVTAFVSLSGALIASNNLSDLTNTTSARTNLGLGSIATQAASSVAITGGAINNTPIGATTASTIAGTTGIFSGDLTIADKIVHSGDTNTAIRFPAADTVTIETAGSERMRIDSAGNLGLGVTPSAGSLTHFEIGAVGNAITGYPADAAIYVTSNAVFASGWKYAQTGKLAIRYAGEAGQHQFFTAPSGTAGNAITFTERMRIDNTGNVGIGTTSPSTKLDVSGTANATNITRGGSQVYSRDNILATVTQSAGVPTGGIIESGSNANGEFTKFADGTMICRFTVTTSTSGATTKTLPATFIDTNYKAVGGTMNNSSATDFTAKFSSPSTTTIAAVLTSNGSLIAGTVQATAIGQWF